MMTKKWFSAVVLVVLVPFGAAAEHMETVNGVDVTAGLTTPDSALYDLELMFDRAALAVGVRTPGEIAAKRAAEVHEMAEENDTVAMNRALTAMDDVIGQAPETATEDFTTAETVLREVEQKAPGTARRGIENTRKRIDTVQQHPPERQPADPENRSNRTIEINPDADRHTVGVTADGNVTAITEQAESVHRTLDFDDIGYAVSGTFTQDALKELQHRNDVRYIEPVRTASTPEQPDPDEYTCPDQDWIDCMPGPGERPAACHGDYHEWVQEHCDVQFAW